MTKQATKQVPHEIAGRFDAVCDYFIEAAKKEYSDPKVPFEKYAKKMRKTWKQVVQELFLNNQKTQALIKDYLVKQEKANPKIPKNARWETWETASDRMHKQIHDGSFWCQENAEKKTLLDLYGISWEFLDRVYNFGKKLMSEEKYQEAVGVFGLLIFLNQAVPEYWLGCSAALYGAKNYEGALQHYAVSLLFDPENPTIFFEMARCFCKLKEADSCLASLDYCIKYGAEKKQHADLVAEAKAIKRAIETKKLVF